MLQLFSFGLPRVTLLLHTGTHLDQRCFVLLRLLLVSGESTLLVLFVLVLQREPDHEVLDVVEQEVFGLEATAGKGFSGKGRPTVQVLLVAVGQFAETAFLFLGRETVVRHDRLERVQLVELSYGLHDLYNYSAELLIIYI